MFIATLVAAGALPKELVLAAGSRLLQAGCGPDPFSWIEYGQAADIPFQWGLTTACSELHRLAEGVDVVVQPSGCREKKLLVADMDSTMITVECLDELADYAGIKPQIAAITEAAMRGELGFAGALDARVALLAGLDERAIDRCLAERVHLMPGAAELVGTMRARGAYTVLVSGGFTRFAEPVGRKLGFDRVIANRLEIADGRLTGTVAKPIVDAATKRATLIEERTRLGLGDDATLAVGDGANDLDMIRLAGLGVAFHAKPVVAASAAARIDHCDLTALLYAQGIPRADWVQSGHHDTA
ncbi:phosphoserine phosphatase SerB [uncultured Sphingomonas sp.]|uniref:phosphoserine phosphatase SerB n=1 Tax=uncultured Sphingomonas sp. TaxID=158754 RepID=UPI0035C9A04A